jgi:hypothetical protein
VSNDGKLEVPVHKELLCFFSSYYTAAPKGNFSEKQKNRFDVALSSERLKSFIAWLYTGNIHDNVCVEEGCLKLYIFADLVDILALRRGALTELSDMETLEPSYQNVKSALEDLTQSSQLYTWMVGCYVAHWKPDHDDDDPCLFDSDTDPDYLLATFVYQVMRGLADRKVVGTPGSCSCCNNICNYHEHESKEEWEASMLT